MVSVVCPLMPSQHLPSYLGFSYLGHVGYLFMAAPAVTISIKLSSLTVPEICLFLLPLPCAPSFPERQDSVFLYWCDISPPPLGYFSKPFDLCNHTRKYCGHPGENSLRPGDLGTVCMAACNRCSKLGCSSLLMRWILSFYWWSWSYNEHRSKAGVK